MLWFLRQFTPALMVLVCVPFASAAEEGTEQTILRSRYVLFGEAGPLGYTELTEFRRHDGSVSYLARERMEFWGPVLDRFVVLTFDARGGFDSGHWVATSAYSPHFSYTFRHDGRVIRGDWQGDVVGSGRTEVPASPERPLLGFWGPLESLLLSAFDPEGPREQRVEAVDVEDTHHRFLTVTIEKLEKEVIRVPAGEAEANRFRTERFGATHHWVDDDGTLLRWSSENDTYRWELEHFPTKDLLPRHPGEPVANGEYEVTRDGEIEGSVTWSIGKETND